jgi:4-aminobutyrate aminotransferase
METDLFLHHTDPREIAAIIVEPIQGEGGYIMPPEKFLKDLRRICDEHGIVLIFDEIQCGVGRTGYMFAADMYDVAPDILLVAKGLGSGMPVGAIVAKEKIMTWTRGSHGSTYAGNPVCCDAAYVTLNIVEQLLENVRSTGKFFMDGLKTLQKKYDVIGDIRGTGFMIGVEFIDPKTKAPATELVGNLEQLAFKKGLLLLGAGRSTIRFCPPLVCSPHEIGICLKIVDECLAELLKK